MVKWLKVIANAGTAFFTTLAGVNLAGITDMSTALQIAIIPAFIQAGLTFFATLKIEVDGKEVRKKMKGLNNFILFD